MDLTDWFVILAIALMAIAFFCSRAPLANSSADRARHARGVRLLMLATCSIWSAGLVAERSLMAPGGVPFGLPVSAHAVIGAAGALALAGLLGSLRASRLLKPRRIFSHC